MKLRLPTTMTAIVAIGSVLAVMPLLASMLYAELALQRLTQQTEVLLDEGLSAAQIGMRLRGQTSDLERATRQFLILQNTELQSVVNNRWAQVDTSITALGRLRNNGDLHVETARLRNDYAQARAQWTLAGAGDDGQKAAIGMIQTLESAIDSVLDNSRRQVGVQVDQLRQATVEARRQIVISAVALLPLGVLFAWGFSKAVARPLGKLSGGIADLRRGDYSRPVTIRFPNELKRVGVQLDWLRRRLARLEADTDRFLRQVSHELKTPLASLEAGTGLLAGGTLGELPAGQLEIVSILAESSQELDILIDNLLAYAEWRTRQQTAQWEWFEARAFVEDVMTAYRLPMAERRLTTELEVRTGRLYGLQGQMRVALQNVVSNAIKHAPSESALEVDVSLSDSQFQISVRDWGTGVPDADKENIFKPFYRGMEAEEQSFRGTGVGLAIVQETMHAHGGTVSVEDAFPGARFRLAWPRAAV